MAEFIAVAAQEIAPNAPAVFNETSQPCTNGFIYNRSGIIFRLASPAKMSAYQGWTWNNCPCCKMPLAKYEVSVFGNIAIPTGGTVEEISMAIAVDGIIDPSTIMRLTPAAVEEYGPIAKGIIVEVPAICGCESVSIVNASTQNILFQNVVLDISDPTIGY